MTKFPVRDAFTLLATLLLFLSGFTLFYYNSGDQDGQSVMTVNNIDHNTTINIFLCGDVMTGRGIDQILPNPSDPVIYEPVMKSAKGYVTLAESENGQINKPVAYSYVWGDALPILNRFDTDVKIINLETSVTKNDDYWKGKGINYRMSPDNIEVLTAAGIDHVSLSNNHILDWGYGGLVETVEVLQKSGIKYSGAGRNIAEASKPSITQINDTRIVVLSVGSSDSGIPPEWIAGGKKPGVNLLRDYSDESIETIKKQLGNVVIPEDIVVISIHWGGNWGYNIPSKHIEFAHRLIDEAGVDIIHGHSSHHPKGIEFYKGKPVIYGAGDFLNDYEGIEGHERYRDDLTLMYFVSVNIGESAGYKVKMIPLQIRKFSLRRPSESDVKWLHETLKRESIKLGTDITMDDEGYMYMQKRD